MIDDVHRRLALLATLALVLLGLIGCTIMYGISNKASCPGVTADQIRAVLEADPEIEKATEIERSPSVRDGGPGRQTLYLRCVRKGVRVDVVVRESPSVVTVHTSLNVPPNDAEHAAWLDGVEYVSGAISTAYPTIGPWELDDATTPNQWCTIVCLVLVGLLFGVAVWLFDRRPTKGPDAAMSVK